jgi:hypothetical protein
MTVSRQKAKSKKLVAMHFDEVVDLHLCKLLFYKTENSVRHQICII